MRWLHCALFCCSLQRTICRRWCSLRAAVEGCPLVRGIHRRLGRSPPHQQLLHHGFHQRHSARYTLPPFPITWIKVRRIAFFTSSHLEMKIFFAGWDRTFIEMDESSQVPVEWGGKMSMVLLDENMAEATISKVLLHVNGTNAIFKVPRTNNTVLTFHISLKPQQDRLSLLWNEIMDFI